MSILTPTISDSLAARINPVAKLGAAIVLSVALLLSIDWVSAASALALESCLITWAGLSFRQFWRRTAPLWVAAPLAGITTVLYGENSGEVFWQWGLVSVTAGSISLGAAIGLRVLAIGIPGIVLFATTDPTDLADGLAQVMRLPSRFVLGGLAGLRLVGLFLEDWRMLSLARRARGVGDGNGPWAMMRRLASRAFALLVLSVRRATKLATAMEAKGFGAARRRTWARPSHFALKEWGLLVIGAVIAAAAVTLANWAGTWHFVLS